VAWSLGLFWVIFFALTAVLDRAVPERYDPEYAARIDRLRTVRVEHPGRPLVLALGSSRMAMAFAPELLPPLTAADGRPVTAFNFSHVGAGPIYVRMTYDRLLREGIVPDAVVLELMPAFLVEEWRKVYTEAAAAGDIELLCRYVPPSRIHSAYARGRLLGARSQRQVFSSWLTGSEAGSPDDTLGPLGGETKRLRDTVEPWEAAEGVRRSAAQFGGFLEHFEVDPGADRAVRDLLTDCRDRGVPAVVLLSPESTEFRAISPAATQAAVTEYLRRLAAATGAAYVDAREWLPDDRFADGHHVTRAGQQLFTRQLGREVLTPLAAGRLPSCGHESLPASSTTGTVVIRRAP
jgi:hypothetical protein